MIKYLQINQVSAMNNPQGVDIQLNKQINQTQSQTATNLDKLMKLFCQASKSKLTIVYCYL